MRPYPDYKKQFKTLVILIMLAAMAALFSHTASFAQTADDIRDRIEEKDAEIRKLEREISAFQKEIDTLNKQKSTLSGEIKELDLTKKKLNADIKVTENKIAKTNLKIEDLGLDIGDKETSIRNNAASIRLGIKTMNELEEKSLVEVILSDEDYGEIWTDLDNMITVRENLRKNIVSLKETKIVLEDTRAETIKAKNELTKLKSQLADQQKVAFEKELEDYEAELEFILDPSKLPKGRVLSWPLNSIYVTSPYAPRWGGFHRGTDFRAPVGTQVKAVADGVVKGTGDTDICCPGASFGKWIFIEHTNGLSTTSAHLSLISVSKDQKVARGQVIGYSGNTGSSTGPHLHVSLYVSGGVKVDSFPSKSYPGKTLIQPISATEAYLDPMKYLPPL